MKFEFVAQITVFAPTGEGHENKANNMAHISVAELSWP
jgi:hypothetical protein